MTDENLLQVKRIYYKIQLINTDYTNHSIMFISIIT